MSIKEISTYKIEIFFAALLLQILYPFLSLLLIVPVETIRFICFSILVLAAFNLAMRKLPRLLIISFGLISAVGLGCQFLFTDLYMIDFIRIYATCFFYLILIYVLTRNFLVAESINLKVVIGAMSGYLLIGYLGAVTIEMMDFHHPESYKMSKENSFDFTYFSFVSMLTVGYGDIIPSTLAAKSLTILISLFGQLYMAVGIASFVGKFMNK